jgi:hypothetical protein
MSDTTDRMDAIQARHSAAMPGPWEFDGLTVSQAADNYAEVIPTDVNCSSYCYGGSVRGPDKSDAEFIANTPTDIAFLLDLARKQQAALDALSNWAGRSRTGFYDEAQDDVVQMIREALEAIR